jgi:hypothetical protein
LLVGQKQLSKIPDTAIVFQEGDSENYRMATQAKLMSISSDLKMNILPGVHKQINAIYRKRLSKYLNLVAINGTTN